MHKLVPDQQREFLSSLEGLDPLLQDLIQKMLEFNPHMRWSAKECLKSPYFDDVRVK
jgi:serine/threonine protein kinase